VPAWLNPHVAAFAATLPQGQQTPLSVLQASLAVQGGPDNLPAWIEAQLSLDDLVQSFGGGITLARVGQLMGAPVANDDEGDEEVEEEEEEEEEDDFDDDIEDDFDDDDFDDDLEDDDDIEDDDDFDDDEDDDDIDDDVDDDEDDEDEDNEDK
jgi:hypothetical protein